MIPVTFKAVLRGIEARGTRLAGDGPFYAFGGADGELRGEAWAMCPACGQYGFKVDRLGDGRARVSCKEGCRQDAIYMALAAALVCAAKAKA